MWSGFGEVQQSYFICTRLLMMSNNVGSLCYE